MSSPSVKWSRLGRGSRGTRWCRARNGKQRRSRAVCRKCSRVGRQKRGRRRECESRALGGGVCTGARRRRGETGVKGLVSGRARPATSPDESARAAGETRRWRLRNVGGGEERTRSGKGRDARAHRTHARRAPPACWLWRFAATARPAPTVRTLGEEEPPRPPRDTQPPEACRGPLEGTGGHLFVLWGGSGTQDRDACRLLPLPHEERGGRAWACY